MGNHSLVIRGFLLGTSALTLLGSLCAFGQPIGSSVVSGQISIAAPTANSTIITQSTQKGLIEWQDFSIAAGSAVQFKQPNSSAITLNRVVGGGASAINGSLLANGQVWLINPNGMLFGKGSNINVGGLIATTSNIANQDFAAGNYNFGVPSGKPGAAIINQGTIRSAPGGSVVLSGKSVSNQGLVEANGGTVVLGGASAFTVDFHGDKLLSYAVTPQTTDSAANTVSNSGAIRAAGGRILMTARAASNVADNVINNTGMVEATTISEQNGDIILDAGPGGTVNDSGKIDASGKHAGQTGGNISLTGDTVSVGDGAVINASGDAGGGNIAIGGNFHGAGPLPNARTTNIGRAVIKANAVHTGNGGTVAIWSDGVTNVAGAIAARGGARSGNGGRVETSGETLSIAATASIDTLAPMGDIGSWLLDPATINVANQGNTQLTNGTEALAASPGATVTIAPSTIIASLATSNVTLQATSAINVNSAVIYSSPNSLNLLSQGSIGIFAPVQNNQASGGGAINMYAGWNGVGLPPASPSVGVLPGPGIYGNGASNISIVTIGGGANSVAVGSASGTTTIAGYSVILSAAKGFAQVGYHGAGGGDNVVLAGRGDILMLTDAAAGNYAQIGNGSLNKDVSGNITGNILVKINNASSGNSLLLLQNGTGGPTWIGNAPTGGASETGNVTIIAPGEDDTSTGNTSYVAQFVTADLMGGDVLFGATDPTNSLDISGGGLTLNTSHNLTLLSTGNIDILGNVQNAGSGTLTLAAGWDGFTLGATQLANQPKAYGNIKNNGFPGALASGTVQIGGQDLQTGDVATGNVAVGSAGGTTVLAANLLLDATYGYAQLGFHGAGGGNIAVNVNPAGGAGEIRLTAGALSSYYAQIGNGSLNKDVSGNITGNILVNNNSDELQLRGTSGGGLPWIGNVANAGFSATGNVSIFAATESDISPANISYMKNIATSDILGGDFTLGYWEPDLDNFEIGYGSGNAISYNSSHNLTLLSASGIYVGSSLQNSGSGTITLVAGWNGTALGTELTTVANAYGNVVNSTNGGVYIGITNLDGDVVTGNIAVGSAGGTIILANTLQLAAINGSVLLGSNSSLTGPVSVTTGAGGVVLTGGKGDGFFAQIGNQGPLPTASAGGIVITTTGAVTLNGGAGRGAYAQIGDNGGSGVFTNDYNDIAQISVTAPSTSLVAGSGLGSYAKIKNGGGQAQVATGQQALGFVAATQSGATAAASFSAASIDLNNAVLVINPPATNATTLATTQPSSLSSPIADLTGGENADPPTDSDGATSILADSLNGSSKPPVSQTIIAGVLRQVTTQARAANNVHGVPPANQDFSGWGNEAFWQ